MDTKKLRQKILDLAIHGKLVPQDPNDEPASVLLERIKAEKEHLVKEGKIKRSKKSAKTSDTPHYENVPFEVPDSWVWTRLGEIFTLQAGKNITAKDISAKQDTDHCYPCYGGNGLRGYVSNYNKEGHFPLIGRQGALCGNVNEANGKFYATEHAVVVDTYCKTNVHWVINTLLYLNLNQYATSTAQPGLSVSAINEVMIPVPPLKEQQRISQSIENWFSLIDQLEQEKSDLQTVIKQAKSRVLDLAIHGKLVPQNPNDEPAIELLKRINPDFTPCDNGHYPQLPDGWCYSTIKEVFIINPRNKVDDDVEVGFVPMANITDGYNNTFKYEKKRWGKIKTGFTHFADGDIAVAKISPCLENRKSVVLKGLPNGIGAGTTELHVFRSQFMDIQYGLYFFKSDYFISQCVGSFNGVVGQQRVSKNIIEDIIIAIPPINEQKRIVYTISKIFAQLDIIMGSL
ncbi:restriction endonuclease subunit S [Bacteroides thetaiotaomicron]|jgi:type I restriction enzyme S subunit|uniref:restriction endonuclease subunit S n=1 Tax=Bacteroides thetaiotaomicron TaxID=818 RepID=UPI001F39AED4|nr:restriction endonuclease subunit S [Bacteroides thetaiotaomicron]MCE8714382.1 restriction endonuclease subunit S [Bacteroides thetaiotaomicron]